MKPRIGFVIGYNFAFNARKLIKNLGKMLRPHFEMDIIGDVSTEDFVSDFEVYWYSSEYGNNRFRYSNIFHTFFSSRKYVKLQDPDLLIQLNGIGINGTAATLAGLTTGTPVVIRHAGGEFHAYKFAERLYRRAGLYLIKNILSYFPIVFSNCIITLGDSLTREIPDRYRGKAEVIPQPIDQGKFSPPLDKAKEKTKLGLPEDKKVLLFVGRLSRTKGADRLASIVEEVHSRSGKYFFHIIGDGPWLKQLSDLNTGGKLRITKFVSPKEIPRHYKASDLLVYPSRKDGLPNVVLEALASGLPVVGSPVGEIPNLITNTYEDPEDFVDYILREDWEADSLPESFSWDEVKRKYLECFNRYIASDY